MDLLRIKNLKTYYRTKRGSVKAVDGVNLELKKGETLGLAGESGCGKTTIALSIMKLLPSNGSVVAGSILFKGRDLISAKEDEMRKIRWNEISMVFQGSLNALNPVLSIKKQIVEALIAHKNVSEEEASKRAVELSSQVRIDPSRLREYPHEFSGGMKQRAMIAMALVCDPAIVICDEPTTALDVMVEAQIKELLLKIQKTLNLSVIYISHDLSVLAHISHKVAILYAGKVVEYADTVSLYHHPMNPYTIRLLAAFPDIMKSDKKKGYLQSIPGYPPDLLKPPSGCRFHPRCPYATNKCSQEEPDLIEVDHSHYVACHLTQKK